MKWKCKLCEDGPVFSCFWSAIEHMFYEHPGCDEGDWEVVEL